MIKLKPKHFQQLTHAEKEVFLNLLFDLSHFNTIPLTDAQKKLSKQRVAARG